MWVLALVISLALGNGPAWEMQGMTYTGDHYCPQVPMGSATANLSLAQLASTGANWVSVVVTTYQHNVSSTAIFPLFDAVPDKECHYYQFVTERTSAVRAAIQLAHSLGLRVMLKPHVDLMHDMLPCGHYWRGEIGTSFSAKEWEAWMASYEAMFLPYARLAEEEGVEMLSINCELYVANAKAPDLWRALVAQVRAVYSGKLTVATNWSPDAASVQWWDAVDYIGVDAYFPLKGTTVAELVQQWQPVLASLEALSKSLNKSVTFTELGFPDGSGLRSYTPTAADYALQATHYEAVFEATLSRSWFLGTFWWNWETDAAYAPGDDCFTPQWKPAVDVLRKYYGATQPPPEKPAHLVAQCYGLGKCTS
jgi:hypothetical protein